jgi:hypothetical protein
MKQWCFFVCLCSLQPFMPAKPKPTSNFILFLQFSSSFSNSIHHNKKSPKNFTLFDLDPLINNTTINHNNSSIQSYWSLQISNLISFNRTGSIQFDWFDPILGFLWLKWYISIAQSLFASLPLTNHHHPWRIPSI